jgi:hypothetical protein
MKAKFLKNAAKGNQVDFMIESGEFDCVIVQAKINGVVSGVETVYNSLPAIAEAKRKLSRQIAAEVRANVNMMLGG